MHLFQKIKVLFVFNISIFDISELHNPTRYLREVPISVVPSANQINSDNDVNQEYDSSSTSGIEVPTTDNSNKCQNTSDNNTNPVEFFISSDGSPILEHTNRVIYLEVCDDKNILEIHIDLNAQKYLIKKE